MTAAMALLVAPEGRVFGIEKVEALADRSINSLQVNHFLSFGVIRNYVLLPVSVICMRRTALSHTQLQVHRKPPK